MTEHLKKYFWLALLAHLLLCLSFSLSFVFEPKQRFEKKSDRYLPAYLYQKESEAHAAAPSTPQLLAAKETPRKLQKKDPKAIALKKQTVVPEKTSVNRPKITSSAAFVQAESLKSGKPLDEPLLKELSRATAAKLYYPGKAAAYRIKGTVTISFLLYPDGRVTDVRIAHSSGFRILDEAALNTIRAISPVRDANMYLTKPRYLLAGIIYG